MSRNLLEGIQHTIGLALWYDGAGRHGDTLDALRNLQDLLDAAKKSVGRNVPLRDSVAHNVPETKQ